MVLGASESSRSGQLMVYGGLGKAQAEWGSGGWGVGRHGPSTDSVCSHLRQLGCGSPEGLQLSSAHGMETVLLNHTN